MQNEQDLLALIEEDAWMMEILKAAQSLDLPDWWICAGFVRSKIWDTLHGYKKRTALSDIDVIYFDSKNRTEEIEKKLEADLHALIAGLPWSVKNQARMHTVNNLDPYASSTDAISKFPETATALGVKLDQQDRLVLTAPCGIQDVLDMKIRPTPHFKNIEGLLGIYEERLKNKKWKQTWPKLVNEI